MKLENGYSIVEMTSQDFFPHFSKHYNSVFGTDHTFFPDEHFSEREKKHLEALESKMGTPWSLHLGLFSSAGEFVGFSFGHQQDAETFYMMASAVFPDHQKKGLYTALVKYTLDRALGEGFQKIFGTHCATNNAVLIPKLKLGFVFSKIELSDMFGTILHLQYYANPLRRKIMDYRSGHRVPDAEIRSVMKFNLLK